MLNRARSACGFSLVELLLVVAALLAAASLGLPSLRGTMTAYRLRASADIIVGELDAARVMAISRGANYEVKFTGTTVFVEDPQDTGNKPRLSKRLEEGVTVATIGENQFPTLVFRPRGTCSGGSIQLGNDSNDVAFINVTGTGRVTVRIYGGNGGGDKTTPTTIEY